MGDDRQLTSLDQTRGLLCRLLLLLGRAPGEVAGAPPELVTELQALTPADWAALGQQAEANNLEALLHYILKRAKAGESAAALSAVCPPAWLQRFQQVYYQVAARNLLFYQELEKIQSAFAAANIPLVLLKGIALARTVYPTVDVRRMGDMDLLTSRHDLARAVRVLQTMGYDTQKITYHAKLSNRHAQVVIELHWRLSISNTDAAIADPDWMWAHLQPWMGGEAQVLRPEANLLYLAAHAFLQHANEVPRLIWVYDLYRLMLSAQAELDWELTIRLAGQLGWETALYHALREVQTCFGAAAPAVVLEQLAGAAQTRQTLAHNHARVARWMMLQAFAGLDWPARFQMLLGLLFPGRVYIELRYQPRPAWLWPLWYPYRWWDMLAQTIQHRKG